MYRLASLILMAFAFAACGNDGPVQSRSDGATLTLVSGDLQSAKAGQELAEPLVVRVTDRWGRRVEDVLVTWTVTSGEGALGGRWHHCSPTEPDFSDPLPTAHIRTGRDGLARAAFMPTVFGPVRVVAEVAGATGSPVTFTADATDMGARLEIVGGNGQEGIAAPLRLFAPVPYNDRFEVLVRDGDGNPVPHVRITWAVDSGDGLLVNPRGCDWGSVSEDHVMTRSVPRSGSLGHTYVDFLPRALGVSTVSATAAGIQDLPVVFTMDATLLVMELWEDPSTRPRRPRFLGPSFTSDVTVFVGATVEFWNREATARIVSSSEPPGGAPFDSETLMEDERFGFVPGVVGTWEFEDLVSGAKGTLSVEPAPDDPRGGEQL